MANRNEQLKRKYHELRQLGVSSKEANKQKYYGEKRFRSVRRNAEQKQKYHELRELGIPSKDANKYKKYGRDRYDNLIDFIGEKNRGPRDKIMILWKDKTETTDGTHFPRFKQEYKRKSIEELKQDINGWIGQDFGEIGGYVVERYKEGERSRVKSEYPSYIVVYDGLAERPRELYTVIATMMISLYTPSEKIEFLLDLIETLNGINPKMANRIADDFGIDSRKYFG